MALFAFFLLAHLSNILPSLAARFDQSKDICHRNIQFSDPYLIVTFDWSKTIQCEERRLVGAYHLEPSSPNWASATVFRHLELFLVLLLARKHDIISDASYLPPS